MQTACVVLLLGIVGLSPSGSLSACLDYWVAFQESCYLFSTSNATYDQASETCMENDAHLVYIETEEENSFLKGFARDMAEYEGNGFRIGLMQDDLEREWRWHGTDEIAQFTDWADGQPNDFYDLEDCAMLYQLEDFQWNDVRCRQQDIEGFVCEIQ